MKSRLFPPLALLLLVAAASFAGDAAPVVALVPHPSADVAPAGGLAADPYLGASAITTTRRGDCNLCVPPIVCAGGGAGCPCPGLGRCRAVNGSCRGVCGYCQDVFGCVSD
ncbi:MAG TPA: hypothetical protein VJV23_00310 [Candidatus Polarisedimenticolia bacterium]|nr:hypothetical protein [Candidatus Polarisedimenticolia bacterium]